MGRFNIYVKDKLLYEELRKRSDINWSKIACESFKLVLEEEPKMSKTEDQFIVTATYNGKTHWYAMDSSSGPMSTGAPYWSEYENFYPLSEKKVADIFKHNGNIGYEKLPSTAILEVYKIVLDRTMHLVVNSEAAINIQRAHKIKEARAKLTDEEKELLGLDK